MNELRSEKDKIDNLFSLLEKEGQSVDMRVLGVFANHMAITSAGFVEKSIQTILEEYCAKRSNVKIARYVRGMVERENSLNCEKIQKIFDRFDPGWWASIESKISEEVKLSVDSLKNIRDQLAHGNYNGTGLSVIKQYFKSSAAFVEIVGDVLLAN